MIIIVIRVLMKETMIMEDLEATIITVILTTYRHNSMEKKLDLEKKL